MRFLFWLLAIELGTMLGVSAADLLAQSPVHKATLHGNLYEMPDRECAFFLDPLGDSEGIQTLEVWGTDYLCDYLRGTREVEITIAPVVKR